MSKPRYRRLHGVKIARFVSFRSLGPAAGDRDPGWVIRCASTRPNLFAAARTGRRDRWHVDARSLLVLALPDCQSSTPVHRPVAQSAHAVGADGVAWMSRRLNGVRVYCLIGDRVTADDLVPIPGDTQTRVFGTPADSEWLFDIALRTRVTVRAVA